MDGARALVVGIAAYRTLPPLPAVVRRDAVDIRDLLVDPARGGYPADGVTLLLDGDATRAAILAALAELAAGTDRDASVLVYLSGHGGRVRSGPLAGDYLLPVDAALGSAAEVARTAISDADLTAALRAIPAGKVLVVFDCCHAGGIGAPKDAAVPAVEPGLSEDWYGRLAAGRGRAILASSRDSERSYVLAGAANSLFTQHLLAGLDGGAPAADGLVRVFDLFEYVQPRVTRDHPDQHPVFKADLEENFPVALHAGGRPGPAPEAEDGYRYDAYVSYADREPDATWVWETLLPRLEGAGLRVAVSGASADPGVPLVVGAERGLRQARRTLLVLSPAYLADTMAGFENVLAQSMDVAEGSYRLLPVRIAPIEAGRLPARLAMLAALDLTRPARADRELDRLVAALRGPLPRPDP